MSTLKWSNRTWNIADDSYGHCPGYKWNPNIPVDANGYLHLNLEKINGVWFAPMIYDANPTGYGTYQWILQGIHAIDPNAVLGLFPYAWQNQHELDIEQGQWGAANNPTWDFMVQPSTETGKKDGVTFSPAMPNDNDIICTLVWTPTGESFSMKDSTGLVIKAWSSAIPVNAISPAVAKAFINLYPTTKPGSNWTASLLPDTDQHYVIKSFSFTPPGSTIPSESVEVPPVVVPTPVPIPVPVPVPIPTPAPFVPVPTILPTVEVTMGTITKVVGNGVKVYVKKNSDDWIEFPGCPYGQAGDVLLFCAKDAAGNVGPFRTVTL
jgi:hypothetical protein